MWLEKLEQEERSGGDKIEKNEMGGICSSDGGKETVLVGNLRESDHCGTQA
jgi:hypothetical protein